MYSHRIECTVVANVSCRQTTRKWNFQLYIPWDKMNYKTLCPWFLLLQSNETEWFAWFHSSFVPPSGECTIIVRFKFCWKSVKMWAQRYVLYRSNHNDSYQFGSWALVLFFAHWTSLSGRAHIILRYVLYILPIRVGTGWNVQLKVNDLIAFSHSRSLLAHVLHCCEYEGIESDFLYSVSLWRENCQAINKLIFFVQLFPRLPNGLPLKKNAAVIFSPTKRTKSICKRNESVGYIHI